MKKLFALCLLVLATVTMSAKTIKEFVVTTQPQMSCQNCENKIKKSIRFEKGVTNIQTDLQNQVVVVTYDADKTNEANLTKAFAKLDYKVTPTTKVASASAGKACSKANSDKKCDGKACSHANADKKCDGKACSHANADKKCDGKACSHANADKKCDGKACSHANADKKCDGKACSHANADKKCDGKCKDGKCKKDNGDCCKNKK